MAVRGGALIGLAVFGAVIQPPTSRLGSIERLDRYCLADQKPACSVPILMPMKSDWVHRHQAAGGWQSNLPSHISSFSNDREDHQAPSPERPGVSYLPAGLEENDRCE